MLHANLDNPTFKDGITQAALKRAREILLASGVDPAKATLAQFQHVFKTVPNEYFTAPIVASGMGAAAGGGILGFGDER